ncbi:hypothetical protein EVAR_80191_1 [Eumeta japonica]|uniref:Uncharacterized protein n=1 Tax=Eumeta variegata TaxID=151549 RepID=A0A4C1UAX7_EUMVA|nr:hypothetical protein EVAR_80191_1 [Eumeta japonica]
MEKFRKRLIHTVAQHLRDNKPLDELWPNMKALTFDCKQLWTRMRALTLKKISRLLPAEDRTDRIPKVARMTFTDWLMFDLVLVHEDIDLIRSNDKYDEQSIPKVLKELFVLVQRFNLEESSNNVNPAGWAAATLFYNHNGRRLISPMLLQKRWYQMKQSTRLKFIHYWQVYKGHQSMLEKAREYAPDLLQQAIAKRYSAIITQDFLSWKKLVDQKKIVMPECFTDAIKAFPEPCDLQDPDLILLEPEIETINLDQDSECDENENNVPATSEAIGMADDVADCPGNEQTDQSIHQDNSLDVNLVRTEEDLGIKSEPVEFEVPLIDETVNPLSDILEQQKLIEAEDEENYVDDRFDLDDEDGHYDGGDLLSRPNDSVADDPEVFGVGETTDRSSRHEWDVAVNVTTVGQLSDNLTHEVVEKPVMLETADVFSKSILTDNMEFVDDGIELVEDDEQNDKAIESSPEIEIVESSILGPNYAADDGSDENPFVTTMKHELGDNVSEYGENEDSTFQAKFDLKLLMIPVVYTTRLEQMSVFQNYDVIDTVDVTSIIDDVISESVPVSARAVNVKTEIHKFDSNETDYFNSYVEKDAASDLMRLSSSKSERSGEVRVSASSCLFQKPRTREYSTVQLCKNPDFNTKLKRLSAGFCTIARNRQFLKLCKPVTIDLHKSFEFHLNNGSLVVDDANQLEENKCHQDVQFNPIMPSAMPIQSLVDKEKVDINDLLTNSITEEHEDRPKQNTHNHSMLHKSYEDKKVDPKDIIRIKRLNDHVLTAEISPLQSKIETITKCADEFPYQTTYDEHCSVNSEIQNDVDTTFTNPLNTMNSGMNLETNGNVETQENADSCSQQQYKNCRRIYTRKGVNGIGQRKTVDNTKPKKRHKAISVPWSSYFKTAVSDIDFNLASDTLNKMLQALGDTNFVCKKGKIIEKSGHVRRKNKYTVRKRNENMTEKGKWEKNCNRTKKRNCCWYSRFHNKVKGPNTKRKSHKCGEVCTCCCKHLQDSVEPVPSSDPQSTCLDMHREVETAVENLQESDMADNNRPTGCVDADKSAVDCIVLSDDDVDDIPKKAQIQSFCKIEFSS